MKPLTIDFGSFFLTQKLEDTEQEQLRTINQNSDMVRFLFFKRDTGHASTLMSAKCRDWYISTAEQDSMPVDMCLESSGRYQTFTVERQS